MEFPPGYEHGVDRATWIDEATGLKCSAKRILDLRHWCGYVDYRPRTGGQVREEDPSINVHGGVTFVAGFSVMTVGFDCGHSGDWSNTAAWHRSAFPNQVGDTSGTYRTLEFVKAECAKLAKQLKDLEKL